jgi:hypothetical protein
MGKILDQATIKIEHKWAKNHLATVTLNWNNELEVRYSRIIATSNGAIFFQPPALVGFKYAKCFIVLDQHEWKSFSDKVLSGFIEEARVREKQGLIPQSYIDDLAIFSSKEFTEEDNEKIFNDLNKN